MTHEDVVEADEVVDGIQIKTYLVRYDLDKDFYAAAKTENSEAEKIKDDSKPVVF